MTLGKELRKGFWRENAVFRLLLGLCPALAVTTSAENGLGMEELRALLEAAAATE